MENLVSDAELSKMQEGTVLSVILQKAEVGNNSYPEMTERTVPSCILIPHPSLLH
jgi:hypothetical protein